LFFLPFGKEMCLIQRYNFISFLKILSQKALFQSKISILSAGRLKNLYLK
jgi:hypothetical protein